MNYECPCHDIPLFQNAKGKWYCPLCDGKPRPINTWDNRFLKLAELISTWSKDPSTKVGAVIVRPDKSIASTGFNGFPQGMSDAESLYNDRETKYSRVIHGEMNALLFAKEPIKGYTLYTWPFLSCDRCAVVMIQAGIKRVVAPMPTPEILARWRDALERTRSYFKEANVEVVEVELSEQ